MRIVRNTPELLILRDRAVFPVLAVLVIAAVFAGLGCVAALYGEDAASRLAGLVFAALSVPLIGFAAIIAREHTHVFDRRSGTLLRRMRRLVGPGEERAIPLDSVRGVEILVQRVVADPDTYGIELVIEPGPGDLPERLPLRNYMASTDPADLRAAIEHWLAARS